MSSVTHHTHTTDSAWSALHAVKSATSGGVCYMQSEDLAIPSSQTPGRNEGTQMRFHFLLSCSIRDFKAVILFLCVGGWRRAWPVEEVGLPSPYAGFRSVSMPASAG